MSAISYINYVFAIQYLDCEMVVDWRGGFFLCNCVYYLHFNMEDWPNLRLIMKHMIQVISILIYVTLTFILFVYMKVNLQFFFEAIFIIIRLRTAFAYYDNIHDRFDHFHTFHAGKSFSYAYFSNFVLFERSTDDDDRLIQYNEWFDMIRLIRDRIKVLVMGWWGICSLFANQRCGLRINGWASERRFNSRWRREL